MKNRDMLLEIAKTDDERILLSRVLDISRYVKENFEVKTTQFLNGHELVLAQRVLSKTGVCFSAFGGYDDAQRKVIACYPDFIHLQNEDFPINIIQISGRELGTLSHRDYLGSILGLGIKREKIGDIILTEQGGYLFCFSDISNYIISQLEKVRNKGVKLQICDKLSIQLPEKKFKEIFSTVASLRLDAVISAATAISRNEAADLIKSGKVTLNWEQTESASDIVDTGQIISIKGMGRMEVSEIKGITKKGRLGIITKRYI